MVCIFPHNASMQCFFRPQGMRIKGIITQNTLADGSVSKFLLLQSAVNSNELNNFLSTTSSACRPQGNTEGLRSIVHYKGLCCNQKLTWSLFRKDKRPICGWSSPAGLNKFEACRILPWPAAIVAINSLPFNIVFSFLPLFMDDALGF